MQTSPGTCLATDLPRTNRSGCAIHASSSAFWRTAMSSRCLPECGRREVRERLVVVAGVVPVECLRAPPAPLVEGHAALRPCRSVLERLELALTEGVVVARARPREALADAEGEAELRERLRGHRRASVRVADEPARIDAVGADGRVDEVAREHRRFAAGETPRDDAAAVEVGGDMKRVVASAGSGHPRDIP